MLGTRAWYRLVQVFSGSAAMRRVGEEPTRRGNGTRWDSLRLFEAWGPRSIPAASTHFVQRYRLVARGPCSVPASELSGLSGEAVRPRPAPWSTRGPRL